jgi:AcrR family transcriptional regulator
MGRPAKFNSDDILDATAGLVAEGGLGRATVSNIAKRIGAPSGSIYHRFESRDLVLAQLWVRTAVRAQEGFLEALADEDLDAAAHNAALHIPRWSRAHLNEATVMLLYRRDDLADRFPDELGDDLEQVRTRIERAMRNFTKRRYGHSTKSAMDVTSFALLDVPYAAVRRYLLAGRPPPPLVDDLVATASACVLRAYPPTR